MNKHHIFPWTIGGSWIYTAYIAAALQDAAVYPSASNDSNQKRFKIYQTQNESIHIRALTDLVTETYTNKLDGKQYNSILVGAPNGGVAHLATQLKCPFLPSDIFLPIEIGCDPDSLTSHIEAGKAIHRQLMQEVEDIEITVHFDPIHDRVDIGRMLHNRVKFLSLPQSYEKFIKDNIRKEGTVVAIQIDLEWEQFEIADRLFFQLGGFGGIQYDEYVDGSARIDKWLETQWTSHRGGWGHAGYKTCTKPESEWGSPPQFTNSVSEFCDRNGYEYLEIKVDHPFKLGMMASLLRMEKAPPPEYVAIEAYWTMNPHLMKSNCLPIWIPYVDSNSYDDCHEYLKHVFQFFESYAPQKIILGYPWVLPTLDIKSPRQWVDMLGSFVHRDNIYVPGVTNLDNSMDVDIRGYIDITNKWFDQISNLQSGICSTSDIKKVYDKVINQTLKKWDEVD